MPGPPAPVVHLVASPSAPREARSFLVDTLRDQSPGQVELATRVTAEMLEMIVRHVIGPSEQTIRVTAAGDDRGIKVTIRERGPGLALGMASDRQVDVSGRRLLETMTITLGLGTLDHRHVSVVGARGPLTNDATSPAWLDVDSSTLDGAAEHPGEVPTPRTLSYRDGYLPALRFEVVP